MFSFFKKKTEKKETKGTEINIKESLLTTKDSEIIRCTNIKAHFNTKNEEEHKIASHDMVRQCMITIGYTVILADAVNNKRAFEEALILEINRTIAQAFVCDNLTVESIEKVEVRR